MGASGYFGVYGGSGWSGVSAYTSFGGPAGTYTGWVRGLTGPSSYRGFSGYIGVSGFSGVSAYTPPSRCGGYGHKSLESVKVQVKLGLFKVREMTKIVPVFRRELCQDCIGVPRGDSYDCRRWLE